MSKLTQYIELTLGEQSKFALPGLGTFRIDRLPARLDRAKGLIYPPRKQVRFNSGNAADDGILRRLYISGEGSPEEQDLVAGERLRADIAELSERLETGAPVTIGHLGMLIRDPWQSGKITFRSDGGAQGFDLPAVTLMMRDGAVPEEEEEIPTEEPHTLAEPAPPEPMPAPIEPIPSTEPEEQPQHHGESKSKAVQIIIGCLIGLLVLGGVIFLITRSGKPTSHPQPAPTEQTTKAVEQTKPVVETPEEPAAQPAEPKRETYEGLPIYRQGEITPRHYIIIASLMTDREMENYLKSHKLLETFPDAGILMMRNGQRRIFSHALEDSDRAVEQMREVRKEREYSQSWIYLDK
ncbi:hypothetical protein [uncultured Porphyromonas sp.]|uniref:HU domain-containing protein n=1 Tax=uncultured Porphyromonas sp. TaxID=159274 RepID=UPI002623736C|nr:hypothetical protein [uncultured Porphyromonas sp.]